MAHSLYLSVDNSSLKQQLFPSLIWVIIQSAFLPHLGDVLCDLAVDSNYYKCLRILCHERKAD